MISREVALEALGNIDNGFYEASSLLSAADSIELSAALLSVELYRATQGQDAKNNPSVVERIRSYTPGTEFHALSLIPDPREYRFYGVSKAIVGLCYQASRDEILGQAGGQQ